ERVSQLGPEHPVEQLSAGLSVAMLARQGAAVAGDEVRRVFHERAETPDALGGIEIERYPAVDTPLSEVAVNRYLFQAVLSEEPSQVAQVVADPLGGHGRVLPSGPGIGEARHPGGRAESGLTDIPHPAFALDAFENVHTA